MNAKQRENLDRCLVDFIEDLNPKEAATHLQSQFIFDGKVTAKIEVYFFGS